MPAIQLGPGSWGTRLENISISGFDIGVQARGPVGFSAKNVSFDRVRQPWDIAGGRADIHGTRIRNDPKPAGSNKSRVGWTRPRGPPLPAFCPKCKSVFPSKNYNFGSSYLYSRDNEEICPVCDYEHAKLSDGLFDLSMEAVRVLTASDMTTAMLAAISEIARKVTVDEIAPETAVEQFRKVSPAFGNLAKRALKIGATALMALAAMATIAALPIMYWQTQVAEEQAELAREQARAERDDQTDSNALLSQALDRLSDVLFILENQNQKEEPSPASREDTTAGPSESKAAAESPPVELSPERLPKVGNSR